MKFILLKLFLLTSFLSIQAQENSVIKPYNKAIVWRGFSHLWSYNHRINRLGSYVYLDSNNVPKGVHAAASGLGSDSTFYEQYYSKVESPHLRFFQGSTKILVTGRETQLLTDNVSVAAVVPEWFQNMERYKSIINGFEIKSLEKSDLPVLFQVHLDDPSYSPYSREIKFNANVNWVANCRSAECAIFSNTTTYEITIHYLLIGWEKSEALAFEFYNKKSYEWTINEEKPYTPVKRTFQVEKNRFQNAFIGIKSLEIILNEEQWMQEIKYKASIDKYDMNEGLVYGDIGMLFLGWKEGMKKQAVAKSQAMFAHKKPGWVSMTLNSVILQTDDAKIVDGENFGTMFWIGKNKKASAPEASSEKFLKFKY